MLRGEVNTNGHEHFHFLIVRPFVQTRPLGRIVDEAMVITLPTTIMFVRTFEVLLAVGIMVVSFISSRAALNTGSAAYPTCNPEH